MQGVLVCSFYFILTHSPLYSTFYPHDSCLADVTPFSLRSTASIVFGLATALGAAFGPGFSIVIDRINPFQFTLPILGDQYFNTMTGPGYFMCVNWILYFVLGPGLVSEPEGSTSQVLA